MAASPPKEGCRRGAGGVLAALAAAAGLAGAGAASASPTIPGLPNLPGLQVPTGALFGQAAFDHARARQIPTEFISGRRLVQLSHIVDGRPHYIGTHNVAAARTIRADRVSFHPGTTVPFLQGASAPVVGVWEISRGRTSHREFQGRVVQSDPHPDFSALSPTAGAGDHATHVAGTIAAAGFDPLVRGLAPQSRIRAYDQFGDVVEMSAEALLGEMLFSNHSYGPVRGWEASSNGGLPRWHGDTTKSATEDVYFGLYDISAAVLDAFSAANAEFLSVWSAGNDRGDVFTGAHEVFVNGAWTRSTVSRPADGGTTGFDTIGGAALAKNVLTVGAVEDVGAYTGPASVRLTGFSSAGPADDGRIKPDVVANGDRLLSTGTSQATMEMSGTSMAAPCATAALALLSEQNEIENRRSNLPGRLGYGPEYFRRSATYKALLIHTADECGPARGPDYMFGWGLINVERAAQLIADDARRNPIRIQEAHLLPLVGWSMDVETTAFGNGAAGTTPVKVTLVWTDPPRAPLSPSLDPSDRALIHDLDLRIERLASDGSTVAETVFPWRLNRLSPAAAATRGDNSVDNVEQVEFEAPNASRLRITVRHKGVIIPTGQSFSLVTTGLRRTPGLLEVAVHRGACCKLDGSCSFVNAPTCLLELGVFLGTTSTCSPNPCPQPAMGACCGLTGCSVVIEGTCVGVYKGRNSVCTSTTCRTGACCTLGACQIVREGQCPQGWQGAGTTCTPSPCAGACCGAFGCSVVPESMCIGAVYRGNGTTCTATICRTGACCTGTDCAIVREGQCPLGWQGAGTTCSPNPCAGACCLPTGCTVVPAGLCFGGVYKGNGTVCTPTNPCRTGACCTLGSCQIVREGQCPQGWQGAGTTCSPNPCMGACCGLTGCSVTLQGLCVGVFKGNGTVCTPTNPCRTGACCTLGSCQIVREGQCPQGWQGAGTTCNPSPCVGACCGLTGCSVVPQSLCIGAVFRGVGTTCTTTICRTGACCTGTSCSIVREGTCPQGWQGAGTTCTPNPCAGACCLPTGCSVLPQALCIGGVFKGNGTVCTPTNPCRTGACCTGPICTMSREGQCPQGWRGAGTTCSNTNCWSGLMAGDAGGGGSGAAGSSAPARQDLLDGLTLYLAGSEQADVNGDGVVNAADLHEMVQNFISPKD